MINYNLSFFFILLLYIRSCSFFMNSFHRKRWCSIEISDSLTYKVVASLIISTDLMLKKSLFLNPLETLTLVSCMKIDMKNYLTLLLLLIMKRKFLIGSESFSSHLSFQIVYSQKKVKHFHICQTYHKELLVYLFLTYQHGMRKFYYTHVICMNCSFHFFF